MKTKLNKSLTKMGFTGYTDAPPEIEKEMEEAILVKDFLPPPGKLVLNPISEKERTLTMRAWKRYRIKDSERGHRTPLSKTLKEPTARLDTSIILPLRVYNWLRTKQNKAAFIREIMIKSYEKTAH